MIKVYHLKQESLPEAAMWMFMVLNEEQATQAFKAFDEGKYYKVAEVECTELEEAYEDTNNIDHPWTENSNVKAFGNRRRSTSAGDIMEKDGKLYVVGSTGYYERSKDGHILCSNG